MDLTLSEKSLEKKYYETISVIGLGYVGLPVATSFAKKYPTVGFDINSLRVKELKEGIDRTQEVESAEILNPALFITGNAEYLRKATFHIVTVPTPIDQAHRPDLGPLHLASKALGPFLKKGDIVVYESTVYPGATEEECVPLLEEFSGLKCGVDFKVGYSPERINPGDQVHRFDTIKKVVAGMDAESLDRVAHAYSQVVQAGVFRASSIKVAEAAKVIENTQRDLNVALINELALIFDRLGVDTYDVLEAAGTKWNFLNFRPGLVGGHCIGVDPYYLTHKAESVGYIPQVILSGRRVNDDMGRFIAQKTVKLMAEQGQAISGAIVTVMGATFKENCHDIRNSRVFDIIDELKSFGIQVQVCDSLADHEEVKAEYGVDLTPREELRKAQAIIVAVGHQEYEKMSPCEFQNLSAATPIIFDVKGIFNRQTMNDAGIVHRRL